MDRALLHTAWRLADETMRPRAAEADRGDIHGPVADNIRALGEAGFFGLGIGPEYGGLGADEVTRHEFTEILASACGVTAFTQQQLQTGIKFVVEAANELLKRELLPVLAAGRLRCGIALSQLRRAGPPPLRAEQAPGGYRLNGVIPWITGWSLLDGFVLGAALDGGEHLFAYVDIARHRAALTASGPLPLSVMEASDTVEVEVRDLLIPEEAVLRRQPAEQLGRDERRGLTSHAALPLGCARASARYLRELAQRPGREALDGTAIALTLEIDQCRRAALTWNCECVGHPEYLTYALRARAGAIVLAMRAAHAAVVATGGRAHLKDALPGRLLREAQFYATAVQTPEVQASTLDQLISPFFGL
ncbi:MAG: acyl-CoA/acyl-ACP dehydrogenase [Armatimonadetes bacterium]|nr:acyl-CoA/acyl-ACP dehydrogenase [Armatimonadota bacterium]